MVEYTLLLVAVGMPTWAALGISGKAMYENYVKGRNSMLSPFP